MTLENEKLFMMLAGKELNEAQLKFFKSKLFNEGLDIGELFLTAVSCGQFEAAKTIINFGYDMNRESETIVYELFICGNINSSRFCIDFYISQGLKITQDLIDKILILAEEQEKYFDFNNTLELVDELKQKMIKE